MQGKLSNGALVAVLVLAFTLFVAGLTHSTDGENVITAGATPTPTRTPTPVNLGNKVWRDVDGDGAQGANEPGMGGITVQLWNSTKSQVLFTDISDANGAYAVIAPRGGTYFIRWVLPGGMKFTGKDKANGDDLLDSDANPTTNVGFTDALVIADNVISMTSIDAGVIAPSYLALTPARLMDTRASGVTIDGLSQAIGQRAANSSTTLQVTGRGGVGEGANAVTLNVVAVAPAGPGAITVWPCDEARPNASSLNTSTVTIANELTVKLSATGTVCIFTTVATHIIADVSGAHVD
ncbi:MAG: SdrD B-like domain-containing protein [Actinomycetota bacterium]|nr:SdrD B-like domain-containing protein [Actinomycetota bacterium]